MNIGLGARRKTVLLVDSDPHARATLRTALEAAGFSVGEAANGREGERTVTRIQPDAILADLLIETVDAGSTIAEKLKAIGARIPIYIVSSAADALVGAVGLDELGVSGVFLKPADPAIVIQTLKTRLAVN
ncbi:MAG TPA: response regulator [Rhodopila sp.]|uniref:response regulator n=1 Tax=Rhodopila sp. TaxID=2480087 RepID=UPI002C3F1B1D|nr:response regulator [Rhodopila sp.]HVY15131.1 response regulator [Rhodopila sp.]